jgi:hypothetical protein
MNRAEDAASAGYCLVSAEVCRDLDERRRYRTRRCRPWKSATVRSRHEIVTFSTARILGRKLTAMQRPTTVVIGSLNELCDAGKRATSEDKRHARDDYFHSLPSLRPPRQRSELRPSWRNRSWLAAAHHVSELNTLSKLTEGSDVDQEYLPNSSWGRAISWSRPNRCPPLLTPHVDGLAAEQRRGPADGWRPRRAAPRGGARSARTTTMAVPATSSDCDRSAQLAESTRGVVFAECNGKR